MLSHDSLTWEDIPAENGMKQFSPEFDTRDHRIVSYLPLSHIAGLAVDLML